MTRFSIALAGFIALLPALPAQTAPAPLFHDEFNGNQVDSGKWQVINWNAPAEPKRYGGRFAYRPAGVTVANGWARFTYDADARQSGRIQSRAAFLYGDVKVRARLPIGRGLWPAIWLRTPGPVIQDEIDLVEGYGDDAGAAQSTIHQWRDGVALGQQCVTILLAGSRRAPDPACAPRTLPDVADLAAEHLFEVRWTPRAVTWLIDGRPYYTVTDKVPHRPMAIVLNLSVESPWSRGAPTSGRSPPLAVDAVEVDPVAGSRVLDGRSAG